MTRIGRAGASILLLLAAACAGGDDGDDESTSTSAPEDETTTTDEADASIVLPTAFRVSGVIDYGGFRSNVDGVVAAADRYQLDFDDAGFHLRLIRIGGRAFSRSASGPATASVLPYIESPDEQATAMGLLLGAAELGPPPADQEVDADGATTAVDAVAELVLTDPAALLGDEVRPGEQDVELPAEVAGALEDLELDLPALEVVVDGGDEEVTVELVLDGEDGEASVEATLTDLGDVVEADVVAPEADEIDQTPWADEEELARFVATGIVAPPSPPAGFALGSVYVLEPFETAEGCPEVLLDYYEVADPNVGQFVQLYLLGKSCATSADPTPFDEVTAGLPSRYGGFEVVVGETVVQIFPSQERFDLAAFAATLAPTTGDALLASIVPVPE